MLLAPPSENVPANGSPCTVSPAMSSAGQSSAKAIGWPARLPATRTSSLASASDLRACIVAQPPDLQPRAGEPHVARRRAELGAQVRGLQRLRRAVPGHVAVQRGLDGAQPGGVALVGELHAGERERARVGRPAQPRAPAEFALHGRLLQREPRLQLDRRVDARRDAAGRERLQRHLADQRQRLVAQPQRHVAQLDAADVELQARPGADADATAAREVVGVAHALGVARPGELDAAHRDAVDDELAREQRQHAHGEGGLVERCEGIAAADFAEPQPGRAHFDARQQRQRHRPVDRQRAAVFALHPVDGDALVALGIETCDQPGDDGRDDEHEAEQAEGGSAQPQRRHRRIVLACMRPILPPRPSGPVLTMLRAATRRPIPR